MKYARKRVAGISVPDNLYSVYRQGVSFELSIILQYLHLLWSGIFCNKPFHEASYILAGLRHSLVKMLQPITGGIQSYAGWLLPISSGTEFEMCRQSSRAW